MNAAYWQTKLLARIHDPGEKSFVLFGDRAGHEGGTVRILKKELFGDGLDNSIKDAVKKADWWAAAADRPQWPRDSKYGAQVRWEKEPVLIHPLSGKSIQLSLKGADVEDIKGRSWQHFHDMICRNGDHINYEKTLFKYWRFCSELDGEDDDSNRLGSLWSHLPADTRVPDHSIWDHLDLTSAFAGAFVGDKEFGPALLVLSIGPVQSFISNGRSTSDLWSASHLLSVVAWEAMQIICSRLGPDAIIFPKLRGLPIVDHWLEQNYFRDQDLFADAEWKKSASQDANPLFRASLPNRFVAVVPYSEAKKLASEIEDHLRMWVQGVGKDALSLLLEAAGMTDENSVARKQIQDQLRGFPEIAWTAVPFSLIRIGDEERQKALNTDNLLEAMAPFFGNKQEKCGFLASEAWEILQKPFHVEDDYNFYDPNPGVLYPAIYDLAERVLAAAKNTRFFEQLEQSGWRCSITGESEWLTVDRSLLGKSDQDGIDTLWAKVSESEPSLAKNNERLGALAAVKRTWPRIFANRMLNSGKSGEGSNVFRYVVSTHTMAIAKHLEEWMQSGNTVDESDKDFIEKYSKPQQAALPRKLLGLGTSEKINFAKKIPIVLENLNENNDQQNIGRLNGILKCKINAESYYALVKLDGDCMGSILSDSNECAITYAASFHQKVRAKFDSLAEKHPEIKRYGESKRVISPGRHIAISAALNDFSLQVVPHIIEKNHLGRVIYAGGDDVLAMLPVADVLSAILQLRVAYSGVDQANAFEAGDRLQCEKGYLRLFGQGRKDGRLYRMMGDKATVSCGAVIAHHKAPLAFVLRELNSAEKRAKNEGGRDAFNIVVIKRSGGILSFYDKWSNSFDQLQQIKEFLSLNTTSRRVVYGILERLSHFPKDCPRDMLEALFFDQVCAHSSNSEDATQISGTLAALAHGLRCESRFKSFLLIAEFLSREVRRQNLTAEADVK